MQEICRISLIIRLERSPDLVHVMKAFKELRHAVRQVLPDCSVCSAPSQCCVFSKASRPAPASPGCIAKALVLGIVKNAGEALGDHKNVGHRVFHFSRYLKVFVHQVLHAFEVHEQLLPIVKRLMITVGLTRGVQVLHAQVVESLLLEGHLIVLFIHRVQHPGQGSDD